MNYDEDEFYDVSKYGEHIEHNEIDAELLGIKRRKLSPVLCDLFANEPSPTMSGNLTEKQKEVVGVPSDAINFSFRLKKDTQVTSDTNVNKGTNVNDDTNVTSKYDFIFEYPKDENGRYILPKEFVTPALSNYCSKNRIRYTTTNRKVYDFIFDYEQDENGRYILPKEVVTPTLSNYCSLKGIRYTTKNN